MSKVHKCGQTPHGFIAAKYDWVDHWMLVVFTNNKELFNAAIAIDYCPFCGANLDEE